MRCGSRRFDRLKALSKPKGEAPGQTDPGAGNRNMTQLDIPGLELPAPLRATASKEA